MASFVATIAFILIMGLLYLALLSRVGLLERRARRSQHASNMRRSDATDQHDVHDRAA